MDAHQSKALRQKYSSALMSNQKWRKLFLVMAEHGADFSGIEYRFTDTANVLFGHAPSPQQVWETAIDDPVEGAGGPVEYKHIESVFIPFKSSCRPYKNAPTQERTLKVGVFVEALESVGKFPLTETEKGIVIHGYKT